MTHSRKPAPARTSRPIPALERAVTLLALGSAALAGCENPFYPANAAGEQGVAAATVAPPFSPATVSAPPAVVTPPPSKYPVTVHHMRTAGAPMMVRPAYRPPVPPTSRPGTHRP